jgi:hypothetical protein
MTRKLILVFLIAVPEESTEPVPEDDTLI